MTNNILDDRQRIAASQKIKEGEYWLQKLSGELTGNSFPFSPAQTPQKHQHQKEMAFQVPDEVASRLIWMSRDSDVSLHVLLVAALVILISRHTGNDDIILGIPIYKPDHGDEDLLNTTLPLRNQIRENMTFLELLMQVKGNVLEAYQNQNYPLPVLLEQLGFQVTGNEFTLFDTAVLLENIHPKKYIQHLPINMIFSFSRIDEAITGVLQYNSGYYEEAVLPRVVEHLNKLLKKAVFNVKLPLAAMEILSEEEKTKILQTFNDTACEYPEDKIVHRLFERQVRQTPDNTALISLAPGAMRHAFTYRELNHKSNQLAGVLKKRGITPNTIVGIMTTRSLEMMIAILGILKAGGAFLPIDPTFPGKRINYILKDSRPSLLLTNGQYKPEIKNGCEIVNIDELNLSQGKEVNPETTNHPHDACYVIYTSGSTGKPKGVMIKNNSLVNFIKGITDIIDFEERDNILSLTTLSFDIFYLETLLPLTKGCKVIIGGKKEQLNLEAFTQAIYKEIVTILQLTPSRLLMIISDEPSGNCLISLKYLLVGGENFPEPLLDRTREFTTGTIFNLYGPTETTIWSTVKRLDKGGPLNIGKPIANTRVYIVNKSGTLQPIGVAGELLIAGDGLARGYLNRPGLTAERFIRAVISHSSFVISSSKKLSKFTNDQCPMTNDRLYLTGDLARWLPDGSIEFFGRQDNQIKLRGYRIELAEIERQLARHEAVNEAVVLCKQETSGDKYLCAYIALHHAPPSETGEAADKIDFRDYLSGFLPGYMIPSHFFNVEEIPLLPNGKMNRKALLELEPEVEGKYLPPGNEIEETLVEMWSEVLEIKKEAIGIDHNFFEMGGDSIKAIQLISIAAAKNIHFNLNDVFQYKTIKKIVENVDLNKKREIHFEKETIKEAPLTPIQKWFFQLKNPYPHFFNVIFLYELAENTDIRILEKAFRKIIEHHDSLRINFIKENGEWKQVLTKITDIDFSIEYIKIDNKNLQRQNKKMMNKIYKIQSSFNLHKGLLLKVTVFDLGKAGRRLFIVIQHLICDVVSSHIFLGDLISFYAQYVQNTEITFKSKTTPFLEWSKKIHTGINPEDIDISYWQEIKQSQVDYLVKKNVKNNIVAHMRFTSLSLTQAQTKILMQRVTRKYNITFEELLLSTLIISLHNVMKLNNVLLEIESHGREELFEDVDLSRTIGCFTNKLPILLKYSGDIEGTLAKTKETLKRIPLRGIHYNLAKYVFNQEDAPDLDCQVGFNYQGESRLEKKAQKSFETLWKPYNKGFISPMHPKNQSFFIFEMLSQTQKSQLQVHFIYNRKHLKPRLIKCFREDFWSVLKKMIEKDFWK